MPTTFTFVSAAGVSHSSGKSVIAAYTTPASKRRPSPVAQPSTRFTITQDAEPELPPATGFAGNDYY